VVESESVLKEAVEEVEVNVGITAAWTVKPCQADRSGNYGQLELSFSWSCTGGNTGMRIAATSSVDKYGRRSVT
jgi:hypothetical protein